MKNVILVSSLLLMLSSSAFAGTQLDFDLALPDGSGSVRATIGDRPAVIVTDRRPAVIISDRYPSSAYWQDWQGYLPRTAIVGGFERGRPLYICRAEYNGGLHPGKVVGRNCNISYGGNEIIRGNFQLMVGNPRNFAWTWSSGGFLPANAVVGGDEDGHYLYICHGSYRGGVHPGKIVGPNCNIGYGGREVILTRYQVLTQR